MTRLGRIVSGFTGHAAPVDASAGDSAGGSVTSFPANPPESDLLSRLTPLEYHVTQEAGTERPFTGRWWNNHDDGVYRCIVCNEALFDSGEKFESGTGWPSFWDV